MSYVSLDPFNAVVNNQEVVISEEDDDDKTVIMSNTTAYRTQLQHNIPQQINIATTTERKPTSTPLQRKTEVGIKSSHAILDTGATAIFVMESAPVNNKRVAKQPLTISLPDGTKVKSTHECDVHSKASILDD